MSETAASLPLQETAAWLAGDEGRAGLAADAYWPKWDGPWWRMVLLHELGEHAHIPSALLEAHAEALDARCLHHFPVLAHELPPGVDPYRQVPCFCQLGIGAAMMWRRGVPADARMPWLRAFFKRYHMADGGWNCDEQAYTRATPRGSALSTVAVLEALLEAPSRDEDEERALDGAARYLLDRRLIFRKGTDTLMHEDWLVPTFPRFYFYDALRGLHAVCRWAALRGERLASAEVGPAFDAISRFFASGAPPRREHAGSRTLRLDAAGVWQRGHLLGSFPLLDAVEQPEVARDALDRSWQQVRRALQA